MKNENLIIDAINAITAEQPTKLELTTAADMLRRFLLTNTLEPALGKLNLYNYVSKEVFRSTTTGVYHDAGTMIATDRHVLIALQAEYNPEKEGKIIAKDGTQIDGQYPDWRAVIPRNNAIPWIIDNEKVADAAKRAKLHKKEIGNFARTYVRITVNDTPYYFDAILMQKLAVFAAHIGADTLLLPTDQRRAAIVRNGESVGLLLPVVIYNDPDDDTLIIDLA